MSLLIRAMRTITTTLLFLATCALQAQYELTVLSETYENLEGATSLNNGEVWDAPAFTIPIGFDFQLGPENIDTIFMSDDNTAGLLTTVLDVDEAPFGAFAPVLQDIVDRGLNTGVSQSPLSFLVEGVAGSRIFKLEWNNVGFFDDNGLQDFMNFQLWLYEEGSIIEYRYGPNEINNPSDSLEDLGGLQIALFPFLPAGVEGSLEEDAYILSGDPASPEFITLSTTDDIDDAEFTALEGVVPDGTVYRFSSDALSLQKQRINHINILVYPNPTSDFFNVDHKGLAHDLEIYNVSGQRITNVSSSNNSYNISALSKGVYFVKIQSALGVVTKRLIKS